MVLSTPIYRLNHHAHIYECEPVHSMHEAKWRRAKNNTDNRRTRGSIFGEAITNEHTTENTRNERTSRLWAQAFRDSAVAQAAPVNHCGVLRQLPSALVKHSAAPGQTRSVLRMYPVALGRDRTPISEHLRLWARLAQPSRANELERLSSGLQRPTACSKAQPNRRATKTLGREAWSLCNFEFCFCT